MFSFLQVQTLSEARAELATVAGELGVRTPRPHQPRQPPWELVRAGHVCVSVRVVYGHARLYDVSRYVGHGTLEVSGVRCIGSWGPM